MVRLLASRVVAHPMRLSDDALHSAWRIIIEVEVFGGASGQVGTIRMKHERALSGLARRLQNRAGGVLVDAVVAIAALGVLGTGIAGAVQAGLVAQRQFEIQSTSENLLRNQLQYVFDQAYTPAPSAYLAITPPPRYSIVAEAVAYDATSASIQTVRITVLHDGTPFRVFETVRADW